MEPLRPIAHASTARIANSLMFPLQLGKRMGCFAPVPPDVLRGDWYCPPRFLVFSYLYSKSVTTLYLPLPGNYVVTRRGHPLAAVGARKWWRNMLEALLKNPWERSCAVGVLRRGLKESGPTRRISLQRGRQSRHKTERSPMMGNNTWTPPAPLREFR